MSVNMNVRRVGPALLAALRRDPSLTSSLCDGSLDFDPVAYEAEALEGVPEEGRAAARSRLAPRVARAVACVLAPRGFGVAGLAAGVVLGAALHLGRAFWGMDELIGVPAGQRIVAEAIGEEIGDDVGYSPARLIAPSELAAGLQLVEGVTLADALAPADG